MDDATGSRDRRIAAVASLDQPIRRRLYELLADRDRWITRDEAAAALDVARSVTAFHLDKLAEAGVVEVSFERTSGKTGPGAGRPSKIYRLAADELSASMPERRYDLAGQMLADAVARSATSGVPVATCLHEVARETGRATGRAARDEAGAGGRTGEPDVLAAIGAQGYAPCVQDEDQIVLSNCPFHRLAEHHRSLVCGMNLDYLTGFVEGFGPEPPWEAHLLPEPGYCCVRLRPQ